MIPLRNIQTNFIIGDPLMRKIAHHMARNVRSKRIPDLLDLLSRDRVQLRTRDIVRALPVPVSDSHPDGHERVAQPGFSRVVAQHVGAAEVGFPVGEDGAEVDDEDVVGLERAVGWVVCEGAEGVGSAAD